MATDARQVRRRRRRERQAVVFGSLVAGLALAGLGAAAVYTDVVDVPFLERDFASKPPTVADPALASPPCPREGALPVAYDVVQVRVLNGTDRRGLAGATAQNLGDRGFTVVDSANAPAPYPGAALISFGEAGIDAAYTLAAHVPDADLRIDRREGAEVDLVLGDTWTQLADPSTVTLDPETPLEPAPGCVPISEALAAAPTLPATPSPTETPAGEAPADDEGAEG